VVDQPLLSIVITCCSLDRLDCLLALLEGIRGQTYPRIETIVVTERSPELHRRVEAYARQGGTGNLKVVFNDGEAGASAARNLGVTHSSGDIVALMDDDSWPFPDWAEQTVRTYDDPSVVGVTGPALPLWPGRASTWYPEELHWVIGCTGWFQADRPTEVRNVWLQNASFRREAFELAGMLDVRLGPRDGSDGFKGREFAEGLMSEEVEYSLRVRRATGKRILYNPAVKVRHRVDPRRLTLGYTARWSRWMGVSKRRLEVLPAWREGGLTPERALLRRILTRLLPRIAWRLLTRPVTGWRQLCVTVAALLFVAIGYYGHRHQRIAVPGEVAGTG
jgi:GT2 family glycosyltransferase